MIITTELKGLSIREPWAGYIRDGPKDIETRTWHTNYRGWLLLCASQKPKGKYSSNAFALAKISDSRPMIKADEPRALVKAKQGLFSWVLSEIVPLNPFPVKGALSLFKVSRAALNHLADSNIIEIKPKPNLKAKMAQLSLKRSMLLQERKRRIEAKYRGEVINETLTL